MLGAAARLVVGLDGIHLIMKHLLRIALLQQIINLLIILNLWCILVRNRCLSNFQERWIRHHFYFSLFRLAVVAWLSLTQ